MTDAAAEIYRGKVSLPGCENGEGSWGKLESDSFGAAFGRLVKANRAEEKLTQGQLAERVWPGDSNAAETRKGDISKLERGKIREPHAHTVKCIADALGISAEQIDTLRRQAQMTPQEQLDAVPTLSRDQLELLASRFEMERPHDRSDGELRGFLDKKAEEYRAHRAQIDGLDDRIPQIHNLKGAAQEAAGRLDFDEVEDLLSRVSEVELEIAAETSLTRANNALLRGRMEQAYTILSAAADSFGGVDPLEPARRRHTYQDLFFQHGNRYGGTSHKLMERMVRQVIAQTNEEEAPYLWGMAQNSLGLALQNQGSRTDGPNGATLLAKAVTAYRAALRVFTEAEHPVNWAITMQNLASALRNQGTRTDGRQGAALLAAAVTTYREALRVRTEAENPVNWAITMQNLAIALQQQGTRTDGPQGAALLDDAERAYAAARRVNSKSDIPVEWAKNMVNMAVLERARADHDTCTDPRPHLEAGLAHVEAALTVFDPEHMPYYYGTATELRDDLRASLAALD